MTTAPPYVNLGAAGPVMGAHYCHFFEDQADLAEAVLPFIAAGLANNERCLWVTAAPLPRDEATRALAAVAPDLDRRMARGQIEILDHSDWYLAAGGFDAGRVIEAWLAMERDALAAGYAGIRITGNTFWLETPQDFASFSHYEKVLNERLGGRRITCLCSYPISRCDGPTLLEVIRNHDFAMVRRKGDWEIVESASLKESKTELTAALEHKNRLLTEIHHRVKNNLQIVSSLLMLKADRFGGPQAGEALDDVLHRIQAMALVHELLYQQGDASCLCFGQYLRRLAEVLSQALDIERRFTIEVSEAPDLPPVDLDTAIPLGIAAAEAITNALKHAFHGRPRGTVRLELAVADGHLLFTVADDGNGMPTTEPSRSRVGAGLTLIRGLANQVGGQVETRSGDGLAVRFSIPLPH
ncbi:MAG: sensor histidine kinase [Solirubrobacterales bacterium]